MYSIFHSQALFGYLHDNDVDAYTYNITYQDFRVAQELGPPYTIPQQPVVLISVSAFPQACENTKDSYFSLALVADPFTICTMDGPLPATDYDTLPAALTNTLEPGKTVLVVTDEATEKDRFIYKVQEAGLDMKWFLPKGCNTTDGIQCSPDAQTISAYACNPTWLNETDEESTIQVQLVVFDGNGDYTMNIGISEECYVVDPEMEALLQDNQHLVDGCEPLDEIDADISSSSFYTRVQWLVAAVLFLLTL